jgi:hypothetical protein
MKPLSWLALVVAIVIPASLSAQQLTASQVQATAKEAYIYGFPVVDYYRAMFFYFVDTKSPVYKAPFNTIYNTANVYTPADTTVQSPNSDTPYSFAGLDLRAEPYVLTLPPIDKNRYYSVQLIDLYTFNFGYAGTRTTGNGGGDFLIAGPDWHGSAPAGITKVIRCDTQFALALIRTQLFGSSDIDNVRKIQSGYRVQSLSAYAHSPAPAAAPTIDWMAPLTPAEERSSTQFFGVLAFVLQFCPIVPSEAALRNSFEQIGVVPGKPFNAGSLSDSLAAGMTQGQKAIDSARAAMSPMSLFGSRQQLDSNYLARAAGTQYGILGNSPEEAVYLDYNKDTSGHALSGISKYTVHFAKGGLPPVKAFWSMTMYDLPQQLLVANSINRYLINSPMLPDLKPDADGGITLYVQHDSPGKEKESNWLPAPSGPFFVVLRCYLPTAAILNGEWKQPPIIKV